MAAGPTRGGTVCLHIQTFWVHVELWVRMASGGARTARWAPLVCKYNCKAVLSKVLKGTKVY